MLFGIIRHDALITYKRKKTAANYVAAVTFAYCIVCPPLPQYGANFIG